MSTAQTSISSNILNRISVLRSLVTSIVSVSPDEVRCLTRID